MDLRLLLTVLVGIFFAEIGDKTQLAVLAGTSASKKPLEVFIGACAGLILATAVGVLAGHFLGQHLPERWIKAGSGVLFVGIGIWLIWKG